MSAHYTARQTPGTDRWKIVGACGTIFDDDSDREDADTLRKRMGVDQ